MAKIIRTENLDTTTLSIMEHEWVYNGLDCCVTSEIFEVLNNQFDDNTRATYEFSKALQGPILEINLRGIKLNKIDRLKLIAEYKRDRDRVSKNLLRIVHEGIGYTDFTNTRSPQQVAKLLYEVLGLPKQFKRGAGGKASVTTDEKALEFLQFYLLAQPICTHLLTLRDLEKAISFLETEVDSDQRFRTTANIAGTNTGRLSSSKSIFNTGGNLQNIDRRFRKLFVADEGFKFGNFDLEQADSRNLGALCWERFVESHGEEFAGAYLNACESGDLHTTVSRMARPNLPWTDDPKENRKLADTKYHRNDSYRDLDKKLGHGSNYIGTPRTMAKHSHIPVSEVVQFQKNYFAAFPCIPEYHNWVKQQLVEYGYLTTLFNRKRYFWGRPEDASTLREAVAFGPQSMTAEEINKGMLNVWRLNRVQLLIQVHDSILFQYPEEEEDKIIPLIFQALKIELELKKGRHFYVPVEGQVGWNWGKFDEDNNPNGLVKWRGSDNRTKQ